jgi:nitrate reductase (NAD(P)H)
MMPDYHIGTLDAAAKRTLNASGGPQLKEDGRREVFLQPKKWSTVKLYAKEKISWDTRIFTYKLDHDDQILGLKTGQHLMMRLRDPVTRRAIVRCYTPISETDQKGFVDVLIKVYFGSETRKGGGMSTAIDALPIGHEVELKGPIGKFEYHGRGEYSLNGRKKLVKRFLMICGGSGVAPIYQVFRAVMRDRQDPTTCVVLDSNRLEEDTLCRDGLDALVAEGHGKGKLIYTLTKGGVQWQGLRGRINIELIEEHCRPSADALVLVCGPEGMVESLKAVLKENGWKDDQVVIF